MNKPWITTHLARTAKCIWLTRISAQNSQETGSNQEHSLEALPQLATQDLKTLKKNWNITEQIFRNSIDYSILFYCFNRQVSKRWCDHGSQTIRRIASIMPTIWKEEVTTQGTDIDSILSLITLDKCLPRDTCAGWIEICQNRSVFGSYQCRESFYVYKNMVTP